MKKISVIMAAYEKPFHLERALQGYAVQDDPDFEIIVTEDGTSPALAEIVQKVQKCTDLAVQHISQEDKGFRKTLALNRAIQIAQGEYLIFTDDDCVPRKDLVSTHRKYAKPGQYIVGAYNRLPPKVSRNISVENIRTQWAFNLFWLMGKGYLPTRGFVRMLVPKWLAGLLDLRGHLSRGRFPGGHSSCFKKDALAIGGFNELMAYGLEDREFGTRLCNYGITGKRVKNSTFMLHLDHNRPYYKIEEFNDNREILEETIKTGRIKSSHWDQQ